MKFFTRRTILFFFIVLALMLGAYFFLSPYLENWKDNSFYLRYPEPSFGASGVGIFPEINAGKSLALQKDRKILLGGSATTESLSDFALIRFSTDGSKDRSFGDEGIALIDFGGDDQVHAILLQDDQKILAFGSCEGKGGIPSACAARLLSNGALDETFATGGKLWISSRSEAMARAAVSDGDRTLVAGIVTQEKKRCFALWRVRPDGSLDPSFGDHGGSIAVFGKGNAEAFAIAVQPDHRIVVGGFAQSMDGHSFALARFTADGSLDSSFGENGIAKNQFRSNSSYIYSVSIEVGGKILVGGAAGGQFNYDFAIARFDRDGKIDPTFGFDGVSTTPIGTQEDVIYSLQLLPSGKILAVGTADLGHLHNATVLSRFLPNGNLDPLFGENGTVLVTSGQYAASASAIQANGKILVTGTHVEPKSGAFGAFVARFSSVGRWDQR